MLKKIVLYSTFILVLLLFQTCTKKNDFLLQYKPNITEIDPTEGYPESLITITGKGFSSIIENNRVTINHIEATVVEATANELKVIVPEYATTGKIKISIYYKNIDGHLILIDSTISTQNFIIHNNYISTPIVNNFSPTQANYNTLIQLTGKNFSNATPPNSDTPLIVVGVDTMQVKAFTDTSILFLISKPLQIGEYLVSVIKKNRNDNNKSLIGFSKNNLAIVASALQLKETDIMIGDSLHIVGKGLKSAMNVFLTIGNNKVLCPIPAVNIRTQDTLLAAKISNDIFQYINPKTSDVFNVSVLFNNQQTLSAGSVRVSIAASEYIWLQKTSVTNIENIIVKYNATKISTPNNATLYLKVNNNIVSQNTTNPTIVGDSFTFDKAILKNILGVNEDSKIVQAEIKILTANGNETTYFLGNLTINAVPVYNTPFNGSNNLKANDVITITGTHITPNVNLYKLVGFLNGKIISATTATSTAITFKIPTDIPAGTYSNIKLQIGTNTDTKDNLLSIIPTITNITPLSGGDSTILTITGYNLYPKNKIYFDTILVNKFDTIKSSYNSFKDTISSNNLVGNTTYVVGISDHTSTAPIATASQTFLYTISQFKVFTNNATNSTTVTDGDSIKVSGKSIQGKNIILKYNNIQLSLPAIKEKDTLKTKIIESDIATLNISDNATNVQAQVYIELTNGTQILAGSIIVKPTAEITGINPNTGSVVKYNDLITITGKHLSSNLGDFELKLENNIIPLTATNGNSIQFRIPGNIESKVDSVYIKMLSNDLQSGKLHNYLKIAPTITTISPTNGTNGTLITMQGHNFGNTNTINIGTGFTTTGTTSNSFQTVTFTLGNNTLKMGDSYTITFTTNGLTTTSSQNFTYNFTNNFRVSSSNTDTTILVAGKNINIYGNNLTAINTIILKYGSASINITPALNSENKITSIPITDIIIQSLNIPDNKASDVVQVYIQTGTTQTLAGSIIVKPTAEITGINPNTGSVVKYNDLITITGKHLSSNLGDFELKLENNTIPLTATNGNSIQFRIPGNIESKVDSVYIKMLNNDLQSGKLHNYLKIAPTITTISPTSGSDNTSITIQGYNFGNTNTINIGTGFTTTGTTSNSFQTVTFILPVSNNLKPGTSYPIKIKTNGDSVVSSTAFTYTVGSLNIVEVQPLYTDTSHIRIAGAGLENTTLYLRYNNGAYFPVDTMNTNHGSIYTNPIGKNTINLLGIPSNVSSATVGVYVLAGSIYTFVGNINIKAIPKLYAFSSNPTFLGGNTMSIQGEHISVADNYRIGLSRIPNDTVWFSPTSLNTTTLNLIISDTLTTDKYRVSVKYKDGLNDMLVKLDTIIIKPTISSIAPNSNIDTAATFTIIGKNLSANSSEIITLLNGMNKSANFSVENASQTFISLKYTNSLTIPSNITAIAYSLIIEVNGQKSSPLNITLKR